MFIYQKLRTAYMCATIGPTFRTKEVTIEDRVTVMQTRDTSGEER
jgi:hypothetical protein